MKKLRILCFAAVCALWGASGCSVDNDRAFPVSDKDGLVFSGETEPVNGRLDVYASMARAAKYNVDAASQNLNKKIFNQNPNLKPSDIIENIMNTNVNDMSPLYDASRVLEYAIIYATSSLSGNRLFVENNFYMKSAQHLSMAAIRAHQDSWFALRKSKEIDRIIRQQQKIVSELNRRLERQGMLSAADLDYKKNLEVALLKLGEMQKNLGYRMVEYGQLVKVAPKDAELEGRRFYELEDFDKKYSMEIFQEAAVRNRSEFAVAKELVKSYNFRDVRGQTMREYPEVDRLDINGVALSTELYNKELTDKALRVANNLVDAVMRFQNASGEAKQGLRRRAFDELGAAILTQIEVNYKLVQLADIDYREAAKEVAALKKEIKAQERSHRLSPEKKIELLNKKIQLAEAELKQSQINGERAMALRSLYFNAGLSPFSKSLLKAPIKDIVDVLRTGFNRDVTEMLAAAKADAVKEKAPEANSWAREENWLETLIDGTGAGAAKYHSKAAVSPTATYSSVGGENRFAPYEAAADKYKVMQLGAYEQKQNALSDWEKLIKRYPELAAFQPALERSAAGGERFYRLTVSSPTGGFRNLCNRMRSERTECLLRRP